MDKVFGLFVFYLLVSYLSRLVVRDRARHMARRIRKAAPDEKIAGAALESLREAWRQGKTFQELRQVAVSSGIKKGFAAETWVGAKLAKFVSDDPRPAPAEEVFRLTYESRKGQYIATAFFSILTIWGWHAVSQTSVVAAFVVVLAPGGLAAWLFKATLSTLYITKEGIRFGNAKTLSWAKLEAKLYRAPTASAADEDELVADSLMVAGQLHAFSSFEGAPYIKALIKAKRAEPAPIPPDEPKSSQTVQGPSILAQRKTTSEEVSKDGQLIG